LYDIFEPNLIQSSRNWSSTIVVESATFTYHENL